MDTKFTPADISYETSQLITELWFLMENTEEYFYLTFWKTAQLIVWIDFKYDEKLTPYRNHLLKTKQIFEAIVLAWNKVENDIKEKLILIAKSMFWLGVKDLYEIWDKVEVWSLQKNPHNEDKNKILSISLITAIRERKEKWTLEYLVNCGWDNFKWKQHNELIPYDTYSISKMISL